MDQGQRRLEFHELLCSLLGSRNVYFQPPSSTKMNYPAIVYSINLASTKFADNISYVNFVRYQVMIVDPDPDTLCFQKLLEVPMSIFDRSYTSDGLNHYVFNVYY